MIFSVLLCTFEPMQQKKYLYILYLIITTIVISIVTQIYFNYKNYQKNRQQFINEVQISLDNSVDIYFAELAKKEFSFTKKKGIHEKVPFKILNKIDCVKFDSIAKAITNIVYSDDDDLSFFKMKKSDNKSIAHHEKGKFPFLSSRNSKSLEIFTDSLNTIKGLTSVFISITENDIHLKKLEKIFNKELLRKNIQLPYKLNHFSGKKLISTNDSISKFVNSIKTYSKSTYLKEYESLELEFPNQTKAYLKKGLLGILLSILFSIAIIASLFYLLNIINKQKAIAEIKNDFISNITHEFKTPITTIGLAIEGIQNFTEQGNKERTKEYLNITNNQLKKLHVMVEKILETSALDSENLLLQKETNNVIELIEKITNKYKVYYPEKEFNFTTNTTSVLIDVDTFHFENAINNIIDNAYKYGSGLIKVVINSNKETINILISDDGIIPKAQKTKIFDKFYRIPQGNQHDVKGFGIGLYYSKKIIEKHQGTLRLLDTKNTIFKISLPK